MVASEFVELKRILAATKIISVSDTRALQLPERNQVAIFEKRIYIHSCLVDKSEDETIEQYLLSQVRTVTEKKHLAIRKVFLMNDTVKFGWLRGTDDVIVAESITEAKTVVENELFETYSVWGCDHVRMQK